MARRKSSSGNFLSIPFLAGGLFVLIIAGLLLMNITSNSTEVKSARDTRLKVKELKNDITTRTAKTKKCLKDSRVTSFVLEGTCENKERDGFSKAIYTCQDGTSGTIEKSCMGPADAFAQAKKACARSICPSPSPRSDSNRR